MDAEYEFPCFYSGVVERDNTRVRVKIVNARRGDTQREKKSFRMAISGSLAYFFALWKVWTQDSFHKQVEYDRPVVRSREYDGCWP